MNSILNKVSLIDFNIIQLINNVIFYNSNQKTIIIFLKRNIILKNSQFLVRRVVIVRIVC